MKIGVVRAYMIKQMKNKIKIVTSKLKNVVFSIIFVYNCYMLGQNENLNLKKFRGFFSMNPLKK